MLYDFVIVVSDENHDSKSSCNVNYATIIPFLPFVYFWIIN